MVNGSSSYCSVLMCKNTGKLKKLSRPDLMFHRFPKIPSLRKEWIRLCGRKDDFNVETAMICSDHFQPEDYQRNLRAELLGESLRRKYLISGAIPSRNLPSDNKRPKNSYVVKRDTALSEEEEIAKRKALVEDALRWAESMEEKQKKEARLLANRASLNFDHIRSKEEPGVSSKDLVDAVFISVNDSIDITNDDSNSIADIKIGTPLSLSSSNIENVNIVSPMVHEFSDLKAQDYLEKYQDLQIKYQQLLLKYQRCYNTLCCFKKAYTKLRSQNVTAKNKIIDLRQKCKNIQKELKSVHRQEKSKVTKRNSSFTQTHNGDADVKCWW